MFKTVSNTQSVSLGEISWETKSFSYQMLIPNRFFLWEVYDMVIRSGRFRHIYVMRAAKRRACTKFHQDSFKTERLVCIETDRRLLQCVTNFVTQL